MEGRGAGGGREKKFTICTFPFFIFKALGSRTDTTKLPLLTRFMFQPFFKKEKKIDNIGMCGEWRRMGAGWGGGTDR